MVKLKMSQEFYYADFKKSVAKFWACLDLPFTPWEGMDIFSFGGFFAVRKLHLWALDFSQPKKFGLWTTLEPRVFKKDELQHAVKIAEEMLKYGWRGNLSRLQDLAAKQKSLKKPRRKP